VAPTDNEIFTLSHLQLQTAIVRDEYGQKPGNNLDLQSIDIDVKFLKVNIILAQNLSSHF
jgi:hypothetical protein